MEGIHRVNLGNREVICIPTSRVTVVFPENGALFRAKGTAGVTGDRWRVDRLTDLATLEQAEGSNGRDPQEGNIAYRLTKDHLVEDRWKRAIRQRHDVHHPSVPTLVLNVVDEDAPLVRVTRELVTAKTFSTCSEFNDILYARFKSSAD